MNGEQNIEQGGKSGMRWFQILYIVALVAVLATSGFFLNPHRVGVLDVNRVARETGIASRIDREYKARRQIAIERATKLQRDQAPRIEELARKVNAASGTEKALLQDEFVKAREEFEYGKLDINRDLQNYQNRLWMTFKKRLQPFIDITARKRKLDVVMDPSASVVYVRPAVDITDSVINVCRDYFTATLPLLEETRAVSPASGDEGEAPLAPIAQPAPAKAKAPAPAKSKAARK